MIHKYDQIWILSKTNMLIKNNADVDAKVEKDYIINVYFWMGKFD